MTSEFFWKNKVLDISFKQNVYNKQTTQSFVRALWLVILFIEVVINYDRIAIYARTHICAHVRFYLLYSKYEVNGIQHI